MFKKRGNFNKNNKKHVPNNDNNDEDEDSTDLLELPVLKKSKTHNVIFKKSSNKQRKEVINGLRKIDDGKSTYSNDNGNHNDSYNDNLNDWYNDEPTNSYFNQFDNDEQIDKSYKIIDHNIKNDDNKNNYKNLDTIIVHRLTPPFLHSNAILSSNVQIVDVIKDKSGDLYKYSKNGSAIINEKRKLNEFLKNSKEIIKDKSKIAELEEKISNGFEEENINNEEINDEFFDNLENTNKNKLNRENLPAYKVKDQLIKLINENQVVIVVGETGSGKTTQLPQFLYDEGYHKNGMIGITQPRRMAAISVAKRVSDEMNVKLGEEVGFTIRFNDLTSNITNIKFMTDGVLLRETLNDSNLNKYSCIIMDEAHERSLNTDILFGIFKKMLIKRRDFKLIITSATMNSLKFSKFFNNAIQFKIPGKTYPVDIMYQSVPSIDYIDSAIKQALKIHLSNPFQKGDNGDILIFMTGQEDIEISCEILEDELKKLQKINQNIPNLNILPVYSSLSSNLQSKIFQNSENRKCIIATNIAETSLTLKHVKFVIDSGLMKLKVYNPKLNMDSLQIVPISKAQANQRSGRAGRVCPGQSFRLFTLSSYEDEMWDEPIPEIQRSNLMNTILLLKNLNIKEIGKFPFIDKPSIESLETSQYELWSIGALNNFGDLTKLGRKMSQFPIDPILSKLLIISNFKKFNCCSEILKIVAMLSVPQIFIRPKKNENLQKESDKIRENFQIQDSDHLTLLNIFNQFLNEKNKKSKFIEVWCNKKYLNYKSLKNALEIYIQLEQLVQKSLNNDEKISSCYDNWEIIKECICACYFSNAAEFYKHGQYKHCRSGLEMFIHSTSVFTGLGDLPKYVVFHELLLTGQKQQMNYITAVKAEWLIQYGGIFYSKRMRGITSRENQMIKEEEFNKLIEFERAKLKKK
jgi:pre-mRNA-splicing factor ATP-dependent RNA helicase DHX38/PRP16